METRTDPPRGQGFAHRVLIAVGIVVVVGMVFWLFSAAFRVVLLLFAGVLVGVLLNAMANLIGRVAPIPYRAAVGLVCVILLALTVGFFWYAGPAVADQAGDFAEAVSAGVEQLGEMLSQYDWGERILEQAPSADELLQRLGSGGVLGQLTGVFSTVLGGAFDLVIILFAGLYFALDPRVYVDNAIRLFPKHRRERMQEVAQATARALKLWFVGQFISMAFVAVFVTLGLWILGVPLAVMIGVISFLLGFIPYLGPILAAVPALLVALLVSPTMVLYVAILYFILEQLQSYVVIPLVQERAVSLPPVLLIGAQLLFAAVSGILGIALATPITVVVVVFIQMLYIEDGLRDRVRVIGSRVDDQASPAQHGVGPVSGPGSSTHP
jgi:predicted PurR-regulated permease PerM